MPVSASIGRATFNEAMLITHRGLSGPAILQISSYWHAEMAVHINLLPSVSIRTIIEEAKKTQAKQALSTILAEVMPKRFAHYICDQTQCTGTAAQCSNTMLQRLESHIHQWQFVPSGTEGYRTAEVTLGGVDTNELSSKTMQSNKVPGLYFIGEVVDVTGHLGGFNFQWAWASAVAAGRAIE